MGFNKFVYHGVTKFDLTSDTVTADKLDSGVTAHDKSGELITGTSTKDSDTSSATAAVAEILATKTAFARGTKLTGTMPNIGKQTGTISTKAGSVAISQGYHDGSGSVGISTTEQNKIIGTNIRKGVTILGVAGAMEEDVENPQSGIVVTPGTDEQAITPDEGYTCFREITVAAIPYAESPNSAGGTTITIG